MGTQRVECHFRLQSESGQTAGVEVKRKTAGVSRNECGVADPFLAGGWGGGCDGLSEKKMSGDRWGKQGV